MGATNAADNTIFWLSQLARNHSISAILHPGDISYADGYAPVFDLYLQKIEPIAAYVPYMTSPGNHEAFGDFTSYRYRFQMPVQDLIDGSSLSFLLLIYYYYYYYYCFYYFYYFYHYYY